MHGRRVSLGELGGLTDIEVVADQQVGPSCGFEAIENVVQFYHSVGNDFSERNLKPFAAQAGYTYYGHDGERLDLSGYQPILNACQIGAGWQRFSHHDLLKALQEDRVAIAIVDLNILYSWRYPSGSWHAITITNFVLEVGTSNVAGYLGVDSNFLNEEQYWSWQLLERAFVTQDDWQLLITTHPVRWSSRSKAYQLLQDGRTLATPAGYRTLAPRPL